MAFSALKGDSLSRRLIVEQSFDQQMPLKIWAIRPLRTREVNNVILTADGSCAGNLVYLGSKPSITESAFEVPDSSG